MTDLEKISQQTAESNRAGRESREQARDAAEQDFKDQREAQIKMNMAKMEADAKLRPTPTPEEIAAARAGKNVDVKEPDGAPLQNERHPIANAAQQLEVGRQLPPAAPVGSDADFASQRLGAAKSQTDRSDVSTDKNSSASSSAAKPATTK